MCQKVVGIGNTAVKPDTQSPNSHRTYSWSGVWARETDKNM